MVTTGISSFITGTGSAMCESNTIRRVPAAHLAAEATQQRPTFTSDALAAIKHFRQCCAGDRQATRPACNSERNNGMVDGDVDTTRDASMCMVILPHRISMGK